MQPAIRQSLLTLLAVAAGAVPALAQDNGINVRVEVAQASYQALKETPVMVSVIKDGAIAKQQETHINSNAEFDLAPGAYDVRLEADGAVTITKRGITVTPGNQTRLMGGPMKVGKGIKIVEYSTGGLAREEVAARLARLDAAVEQLHKQVDSLKAAAQRP